MRKISCIALAALLVLGSMLALASCGAKAPEIPEGYQVYENQGLSFAYPEDWTKTDGSTVILINPTGIGNNITVVYEGKTDMYAEMTAESFDELMRPTYEAMGMTLSNVTVNQKTSNGLDVTEINYTAKVMGVTMEQTAFITTIGDRTYTVTVTETTQDDTLVSNVFNTLYEVK